MRITCWIYVAHKHHKAQMTQLEGTQDLILSVILIYCRTHRTLGFRPGYHTRIRLLKTANTLFTSTVLFPLTKEQTNNEHLPLRLLWSFIGPEPWAWPSLKQQADTFAWRPKTTIITDFQKRVTHFQLEWPCKQGDCSKSLSINNAQNCWPEVIPSSGKLQAS